MSDQAATPMQGKADGYPCPECGAQTSLQPGTESLACDHCGAKIPIDAPNRPILEHDFAAALAGAETRSIGDVAQGAREVQCKVCGARAIVTRHADRCAFCDAPMIVELGANERTILPESVLPFVVTQKDAAGKFQKWLASRWFAPGDLGKRAKKDGLDGVYLPYWTYDAQTTSRYVGQRGERYWENETYMEDNVLKTRRVQKTRWFPAAGIVRVPFDDVLVPATETLPRKLVQKLEPWDLPSLRPFDGKYLAGFIAERYQVELADGFKVAQLRMEPVIRKAIYADIGGDEQQILGLDTHYDGVTFKHILLPLWLSSFRYNEKVYRVTVNARTGETAGERPYSWIKILLLVLIIAAAIGGLIYLIERSRKPSASADPQGGASLVVERDGADSDRHHGGSVMLGSRPLLTAPSPSGTYALASVADCPVYLKTS
jgi:DNA-directed RNA polymerase subunit RPC12/RpoP